MHAVRDWDIMVLQPQADSRAIRLFWAMLNPIENDRGERRGNISQLLLHDLQFLIARVSQSAQLGRGTRVTTSGIDVPAIGQILSGELKPNPAIGPGDQGAWHCIFPSVPDVTGPALERI